MVNGTRISMDMAAATVILIISNQLETGFTYMIVLVFQPVGK